MKKSSYLLSLILLTACFYAQTIDNDTHQVYGSIPPNGSEVQLFSPVSTGMDEFNAAFTIDMTELYFSVRHRIDYFVILKCGKEDDGWSKPEIAPFSGSFNDADPFISHDGNYLYFCSDRPAAETDTFRDWNIWRMKRTGGGWGEPELLEFNTPEKNEMYPTVSANGNVYFHSDLESERTVLDFNSTDIYTAAFENGNYKPYVKVESISSPDFPEWDPFISPDEDYLIFTSPKPGGFGNGDMYISFKTEKGEWSEPKNMGAEINSRGMDYCPNLSPDGKYLFFSSSRNELDFSKKPADYNEIIDKLLGPQNGQGDVYWIESEFIEGMR